MRRLALLALSALMLLPLGGGAVSASVLPRVGTIAYGGDVSWPNCPKGMGIPTRPTLGLPMPTAAAQFVVLGLTNGPAYTPNPCLASQVAWVKARHLWAGAYAVASYPLAWQVTRYGGSGTAPQRLYRAGFAQAKINVDNMHRAGLRPPMVWVDVEPVRSAPWSGKPAANNYVINGVVAGYRAAGLRVGFYSYASGWKQITGGRRAGTVPTWVPSGGDVRSGAEARCRQRSFSGGPVWLGQWTANDRDHDIACGIVTRRLPLMFAAT